MQVRSHILLALLVTCTVACSAETASETPETPDATATTAGQTVPDEVINLARDLPGYPDEMKVLHRLSEKMHIQASECAGFATEERAELAKFDELSDRHADAEDVQRELAPLMNSVRDAVMPKLADKLKSCRQAQRGSSEDAALDGLMSACFGKTRADFPATSPSGSTAYGDPLRLPAPSTFKGGGACSAAASQASSIL